MSHAKEIKHKKEIQAKFQLNLNSTTSHIASWLTPKIDNDSKTSSTSSNEQGYNLDFLNLPISGGGSGLSIGSSSNGANTPVDPQGINSIAEYIKTGKINKKKSNASKFDSIHRIQKDDSKALSSLKNKLKNSNRAKHMTSIRSQPQYSSSNSHANNRSSTKITSNNNQNNNNDSDSDEEIIQKSAPKKNFSLLIDSKMKKKKK